MDPTTPLLSARNLIKDYGPHRVIDNVSLTLYRGETLGLVGESGSGKSTIARLLLRLIDPTAGQILFHTPGRAYDLLAVTPRELRRLRRHMSIVFQDPYAALDPRMSVRQILSEPFAIHHEQPTTNAGAPRLASEMWDDAAPGVAPRPPSRAARQATLTERLHELLAEVHLDPSALARYPHEFSGGQRQRINIARALALRPSLLVLDEPVSALDVSVAAQIINLLRDLQHRHHLTCLFISHSMPLVRYLSHRIAVMQAGRIVESGPWQQICNHPTNPYTQQLLAATPNLPTFAS